MYLVNRHRFLKTEDIYVSIILAKIQSGNKKTKQNKKSWQKYGKQTSWRKTTKMKVRRYFSLISLYLETVNFTVNTYSKKPRLS